MHVRHSLSKGTQRCTTSIVQYTACISSHLNYGPTLHYSQFHMITLCLLQSVLNYCWNFAIPQVTIIQGLYNFEKMRKVFYSYYQTMVPIILYFFDLGNLTFLTNKQYICGESQVWVLNKLYLSELLVNRLYTYIYIYITKLQTITNYSVKAWTGPST